MSVNFTLDHRGMAELLDSEMILLAMENVAHQIMVHAIFIAPIGDETKDPHAGRYAGAFKMRSHHRGGATHDRAEAIAYNDAPEALHVEYGTEGREPYHTLLRAASETRI
jgi:hypothetical protein